MSQLVGVSKTKMLNYKLMGVLEELVPFLGSCTTLIKLIYDSLIIDNTTSIGLVGSLNYVSIINTTKGVNSLWPFPREKWIFIMFAHSINNKEVKKFVACSAVLQKIIDVLNET